jgi:hypothetical protein
MGGMWKKHYLLDGSQASPARPSGRSSMEMYEEDIRMVSVGSLNKGFEILISD